MRIYTITIKLSDDYRDLEDMSDTAAKEQQQLTEEISQGAFGLVNDLLYLATDSEMDDATFNVEVVDSK